MHVGMPNLEQGGPSWSEVSGIDGVGNHRGALLVEQEAGMTRIVRGFPPFATIEGWAGRVNPDDIDPYARIEVNPAPLVHAELITVPQVYLTGRAGPQLTVPPVVAYGSFSSDELERFDGACWHLATIIYRAIVETYGYAGPSQVVRKPTAYLPYHKGIRAPRAVSGLRIVFHGEHPKGRGGKAALLVAGVIVADKGHFAVQHAYGFHSLKDRRGSAWEEDKDARKTTVTNITKTMNDLRTAQARIREAIAIARAIPTSIGGKPGRS